MLRVQLDLPFYSIFFPVILIADEFPLAISCPALNRVSFPSIFRLFISTKPALTQVNSGKKLSRNFRRSSFDSFIPFFSAFENLQAGRSEIRKGTVRV